MKLEEIPFVFNSHFVALYTDEHSPPTLVPVMKYLLFLEARVTELEKNKSAKKRVPKQKKRKRAY